MKKAVILLSGGLDSAVTLYDALKNGYKPDVLIFDYSQRHKKEISFAKKLASINKLKTHVIKIDLSWTPSSLTDKSIKVPTGRNLKAKDIPSTYVPGRNIIFLSYAFSYAESIGADRVFIGAHVEDYSGYPDCRPEFLFNFNSAVSLGLKNKNIKLVAPLLDLSKRGIIELGLKLKVPFQYTWSCYQGDKKPCRKCDSCRFRIQAFQSLGLIDPAL